MRKVFKSVFRRKVKEIMAAALSICLVFGTLTIPVKVRAEEGLPQHIFNEDKILEDTVLLPGDIIAFDKTDAYNRDLLASIDASFENGLYSPLREGTGAEPYAVISGTKYWQTPFIMPVSPEGGSSNSYVYVVQSTGLLDEEVIWEESPSTFVILPYDDPHYNNQDAKLAKRIILDAYPGFAVMFLENEHSNIMPNERFYVYKDYESSFHVSNNGTGPVMADDPRLGELIGWSTNLNFKDSTQNPSDIFFVESNFNGHFFFPDTDNALTT